MQYNKFNIQNNGDIRGQVIGDYQTIVANYDIPFDCPHCNERGWEQFRNGVQHCPLCNKEIKKESKP